MSVFFNNRFVYTCLTGSMLLAFLVTGCSTPKSTSTRQPSAALLHRPMSQETATLIAEAVAVQVYGSRVLEQRPFKVVLKDGAWIVDGTLPPDHIGGTVHVELDAINYCVVSLIHYK